MTWLSFVAQAAGTEALTSRTALLQCAREKSQEIADLIAAAVEAKGEGKVI